MRARDLILSLVSLALIGGGVTLVAAFFLGPGAPNEVGSAEERGAYLLERYLNPNDSSLPDPATEKAADSAVLPASLESRYKFRILSRKVMDF